MTVAVFYLIPRLTKLYSAQEYTDLINRQLCLFKNKILGTSLVEQQIRLPLPMQESQVQFLIWENSTWCRKTKPLHPRACALQQEKPLQGKALALQGRVASTRHNQRKPASSNEDPVQLTIKIFYEENLGTSTPCIEMMRPRHTVNWVTED